MHIVMQLGKNGVTDGFMENVKNAFNTHDQIKISVLKSATRNREEMQEIGKKIQSSLGKKYTHKIVGYTIFLRKWRKAPSSNKQQSF